MIKYRFLSILAATAVFVACGSKNAELQEQPAEPQEQPEEKEQEKEHEDPVINVETATPDTWALVDELGRSIPEDAPNSAMRESKQVVIFYWTWHDSSQLNYPDIVNVTEVQKNHPEALTQEVNPDQSYQDPVWGQYLQPCFWGQPLFGYYRTTDEWVLRKHAEMLGDAGVDAVFFDCTNGTFLWEESTEALMKTFAQAKEDGVNVPKISFILPFGANDDTNTSLRNLYTKIYKPGKYQELWYRVNGKPVLMAYPDALGKTGNDAGIRAFFTFRPGQPDYVNGPSRNDHWGWLECYPQHLYGGEEQMTVGVAQNATQENGGHCYAFNAPGSFGRSYTARNGQDNSEMAYVKGLNFQEQWDYAIEKSPNVIFVTGWNEWIAGRQPNWPPDNPYKPFAFPDQYDSERSRDCEPNAEWGDYGDIYYCQLIENIRRFKGASKYPKVSDPKTVKIGSFEGWKEVSPDFQAYGGNTGHRSHRQHSQNNQYYFNNSGRNDICDARVARDDENIYFYVETTDALTSNSDKGWMRLFINIDRNIETGWKGYDFCLNYKNPESVTKGFLSKCEGKEWKWEDAGTFEYAVSGNKMEIKVSRSALGATGKLDFEFKWNDNMQEEGHILDFYVNGDTAPGGRFNYVYKD